MTQKFPFEKYNRTILVKKTAQTSSKFGCNPKDRSVEELLNFGVINIDKPKGPTSHQVSSYVQKILNVKKSGHSGTLDPAVTGVLITAISKATRIVHCLLKAGKEYVGIMHLHKSIPIDELNNTINKFIGKINQLPPIKSAVKRRVRQREIYYFEILEVNDKDVLFKTGVEAGTYIRKLVHDIGQSIGCGANMAMLRRTKAGPFDEKNIVTMQDLTDAYYYYKHENNDKYIRYCIQPIENAVKHLPRVWVLDTAVNNLTHGSNLKLPGISKLESDIKRKDLVAVMTLKDELVATGTANMNSNEMLKQDKGVGVKIEKVFMHENIYPRM
jgi:tRNA pseudouridine55 synthase